MTVTQLYNISQPFALVGFILTFIVIYLFQRYRSPIDIPGPRHCRSLLGYEAEFNRCKPDTKDSLFQCHAKYGTAYHISGLLWSDILVISDPRALQYILHTSGYRYRKPNDARFLTLVAFGRGILYSEGESHVRQRRILNPAFSVTQLKEFLLVFQRCTNNALDKLAERVAQGADRLNLSLWASQLALDAIGEATFGHEFGALEGHTDDLFRANKQLVRRFGDTSSKTLLIRAIQRYIPIELMAWLSNIKPSNDAIVTRTGGSIRRIAARDILAKAKQEAKGCELDRRRDILSVLVQCNNATEAKKRMSDEEVISQTVAIIQAGHSVTGAFMAWLFHELARHPEDQERIYQEIQDFRSKNGADAPLRAEDYEEMTYLTACLKENLRYHPALPTLAREATTGDIIPLAIPVVSPTTGKTITHIPVQKGQRVMLDFGSYQRLKHVWGEDADTWNPSRFLNQDRKLNFQYNVGMYANILSFSGGVQGCIGWRFALAEAQTIVIGILERLKLILPPEGIEIQGVRSGMNVPMVAGKWDEGMQVPLVLERREK